MSSQSSYQAPESSQWQNPPQVDTSPNEPSYPHGSSLHSRISIQDTQVRNEAPLVQGPAVTPPVIRKRPLLHALTFSVLLRWGIIVVGIVLAIGGSLLISNVALPLGPYRGDQGKALFYTTATETEYIFLGLGDKQHNYMISPWHNYLITQANFNSPIPIPRGWGEVTVIYRPITQNSPYMRGEWSIEAPALNAMFPPGTLVSIDTSLSSGNIEINAGTSFGTGYSSFTPKYEAMQIIVYDSDGRVQQIYTTTEYAGYIQTRQIIGVAVLVSGLLLALLAFVVPIIVGRAAKKKQTALKIAP